MREPYTQLHLHLVWATWDRHPIILPEWKAAISGCIQAECLELKVAVAVATIAKQVKGASSHLMTHHVAPGEWFKWQGGYGAFAVSKRDLPQIQGYIQGQERHHQHQNFDQEMEELE